MLLPSELQASFDLQGPLALAARFSKRALPQSKLQSMAPGDLPKLKMIHREEAVMML